MSFVVLNCQVVEWVDIFANPVFKNQGIYTLWSLCEEIIKKFVQVVSEIYKKAQKVQMLNEVALIQVVRKRVGFQDRKNENTSKFPSIKIWY